MAQRTLVEKTADIRTTFEQFREWLTPPEVKAVFESATAMQQKAAEAGDIGSYTALVQAAATERRMMYENDRAALMAAVAANGGSPARPPEE